jgi:inorganic pyrophosphatase/exopolyphosphatase
MVSELHEPKVLDSVTQAQPVAMLFAAEKTRGSHAASQLSISAVIDYHSVVLLACFMINGD